MSLPDSTKRLAAMGAELLGGELSAFSAIHGGDLSDVLTIELADGRRAVVKTGPAPAAEAAMLQAIAASGASAPAVLGVDDRVLVMQWLPADGDLGRAWASLGAELATLHSVNGDRYGWSTDYAFGRVAIENAETDDWTRFWAERRLLNHVVHIDAALAGRVERLAARLEEILPAKPAPALLHGDLWGGNVLVADSRVSGLIDPACYYGHGEVDLAMLSLFGHPGPEFFEAYLPLEEGYAVRLPVYQLWPALVHLRLFGSGYRSMVERLLTAVGY